MVATVVTRRVWWAVPRVRSGGAVVAINVCIARSMAWDATPRHAMRCDAMPSNARRRTGRAHAARVGWNPRAEGRDPATAATNTAVPNPLLCIRTPNAKARSERPPGAALLLFCSLAKEQNKPALKTKVKASSLTKLSQASCQPHHHSAPMLLFLPHHTRGPRSCLQWARHATRATCGGVHNRSSVPAGGSNKRGGRCTTTAQWPVGRRPLSRHRVNCAQHHNTPPRLDTHTHTTHTPARICAPPQHPTRG